MGRSLAGLHSLPGCCAAAAALRCCCPAAALRCCCAVPRGAGCSAPSSAMATKPKKNAETSTSLQTRTRMVTETLRYHLCVTLRLLHFWFSSIFEKSTNLQAPSETTQRITIADDCAQTSALHAPILPFHVTPAAPVLPLPVPAIHAHPCLLLLLACLLSHYKTNYKTLPPFKRQRSTSDKPKPNR